MRKDLLAVPFALKDAFLRSVSENKITFISAGAGWGKTSVARQLLSRLPHRTISIQGAAPIHITQRDRLVLLEDFQTFTPRMERRLQSILRQSQNRRFVLLSRGPLPDWLLPYRQNGELKQFGAEDLALDMICLVRLAKDYGLDLPASELRYVHRETGGHPVLTRLLLEALSAGDGLCQETVDTARKRFDAYLDGAVFCRWDGRTCRLMLRLALSDTFDMTLVEWLGADGEAEAMLRTVQRSCGCLKQEGEAWHICDRELAGCLRGKAGAELSAEELKSAHLTIARWYREHGNDDQALLHYRAADCRREIVQILTQRMQADYNNESLYALREYYHMLTCEELTASPYLICGMSLLCALERDRERSDYWYTVLCRYAEGMDGFGADQQTALELCAFLELVLPQKTVENVCDALSAIAEQASDGTSILPPLFMTGALPSLLRGCRDWSEWILPGAGLRLPWDVAFERSPGRGGVWLRELFQAETRFERNENMSEFILRFSQLQREIKTSGSLEMEFVLVALAARILAASGKAARAAELLEELRDRAVRGENVALISNIDAVRCHIGFLVEDPYADMWFVQSAPDDRECRFTACCRYLVKVRCYLKRLDYPSALLLLGQMLDCLELYSRPLDKIETQILIAICLFRTGKEDWRKYLTDALEIGVRYGYIAVLAAEGAALQPLLEQYEPAGIDPDYWRRLVRAVAVQSGYYPTYLAPPDKLLQTLTGMEYDILQLICQDLSNSEIGKRLNIKLPTVKTHVHNIFVKLEVRSRAQARNKAACLRIFTK